jgi:hypothetical protein
MEQNNEGIDISKEEALISGAPKEVEGFDDILAKIDEGIKKERDGLSSLLKDIGRSKK